VNEFICEADGQRLDQWLAVKLARYSRGHVRALIEKGLVKADGKTAKPSLKMRTGMRVVVELPGRSQAPGAGDFESWILHEEREFIVLKKPAGLLMHPMGESWLKSPEAALVDEPNLAAILLSARPEIAKAGVDRCGLVHRLDRPTSGLLLVAKSKRAYEALTGAFHDREVRKFYRAIVRGRAQDQDTKISAPIGRKPGHRRVSVTPYGKPAETGVRVVEAAAKASLIEARPLTGRTHQIRAHLALLGHPVAGDQDHDFPGAKPVPPRLMLHAYKVMFAHPVTGKPVSFRCNPPADFTAFWRLCRGRGK
jgi:23S rRNA pseudouridine1911/1915/1917 synthase